MVKEKTWQLFFFSFFPKKRSNIYIVGERTLQSIHIWQGTDCCTAKEERVDGNYNVVTYEEDDKGLGLKMKMKFEEMKKVD